MKRKLTSNQMAEQSLKYKCKHCENTDVNAYGYCSKCYESIDVSQRDQSSSAGSYRDMHTEKRFTDPSKRSRKQESNHET